MDDNNSSDFARCSDVHMALPSFTLNEVRAALCASKNSMSCALMAVYLNF